MTDTRQKRIWTTQELFGDSRIVEIRHEGETYRLLLTRQGKLVLNK